MLPLAEERVKNYKLLKLKIMKLFQHNSLERTRSIRFLASLAVVIWVVTLIIEYRSPVNETPKTNPDQGSLMPLDDPIPITIQKPEKPKKAAPKKEATEPEPTDLDDWVEKTKIPINDLKITDGGNEDDELETIEETTEKGDDTFIPQLLEKIAVPHDCSTLIKRDKQLHCLNIWIAEYIRKNVQYPKIPRQFGIEERIYISFVIDKKGSVSRVEIARGENEHLRNEARRLIQSMPPFIPASQNGRKAAMKMMATVNFKLQ